ncbi:hypothetical protein BCM20_000547 [Clostridium beijerinckii]|nr:hypothetical protein [Clostridium beijerinckii]
MVQNLILCILSALLAMEIMKLDKALHKALITVPESTNLAEDILLPKEESNRTKTEAPKAPKNAQNATPLIDKKLNEPIPSIREKVAPKDAPEEIPRIYGSAKGFWTVACITVPHTASPAPTAIASKTLGIRISQITLYVDEVLVRLASPKDNPKILLRITPYDIDGFILKEPKETDNITEIINSPIKAIINRLKDFLIFRFFSYEEFKMSCILTSFLEEI